MIDTTTAEAMRKLWLESDYKTVYETYPQFTHRQIQNAISKVLDEEIYKHRQRPFSPCRET